MGIKLGKDTKRTWMESLAFYLEKIFSNRYGKYKKFIFVKSGWYIHGFSSY